MGTPLPLPKKGWSPQIFGHCLLSPNVWMDQDGTWHGDRPQPRQLCVRWGPSPLPKKGRSPPQYSAHIYCGQTAGCIKMPLGTEVGLSPGDFVFDGDPATPRKRGTPSPTQFLAHVWPNGWMDEDATWFGSRPRPRPRCIRRGPSSP